MEELKEPLLEMFTDDPVNWVKWAIVFTVLIGFFILSFKIYSKIEYHLSIQKKVDLAREKGHVIEGAKRIKVRKKGTYEERKKSNRTMYRATYRYMLDGTEKEYRSTFDNYPPEEIDLYYKDSPRKLFSVEEYYWGGFQGILYLTLVFMPFVLAAFTAMALDIPFPGNEKGSVEALETGAWKTATISSGDYSVTITSPEEGYPEGDCDFVTKYVDPEEYLNLEIKFFFLDELPPAEAEYPRWEDVLWGYDIVYEERKKPNLVNPRREQVLFWGYLTLGPDKYLRVEIFGVDGEFAPSYKFLQDEKFQKCFRLQCEKTK